MTIAHSSRMSSVIGKVTMEIMLCRGSVEMAELDPCEDPLHNFYIRFSVAMKSQPRISRIRRMQRGIRGVKRVIEIGHGSGLSDLQFLEVHRAVAARARGRCFGGIWGEILDFGEDVAGRVHIDTINTSTGNPSTDSLPLETQRLKSSNIPRCECS